MLKTFSMTDVGMKRQLNQDYVFTSETAVGNLPNLFIVADGMGGHNAGDYASKYTTQIIVDEITRSTETNPIKIIRGAIEVANREIREKSTEGEAFKGMGTTVVVATIIDRYLYVANVGDSRLYVLDEDINQITRDHSLVEEMVRMGEIDREAARNHPDKNIITRAVGAADEVKIDFFDMKLKPGDIILMCTDGLTNMIEDEEIRMILNGQRDLVETAEELIRTANNNGGRDNIAVVLVEPFSEETSSGGFPFECV